MTELRRALPFLLLPLLLPVAGCSLLPGGLFGGPDGSAPQGTATRAQLEAHHRAWVAAGITDYRLEVGFSCLCPAAGPVVVTVADGQVVDVQPADAGVRSYPLTVDAIYDHTLEAIDGGGTAEVTWLDDAVPAMVLLDPIPSAIDDELSFLVGSLTPAP